MFTMVLKYIKFTIWSGFSLEVGFYPKQRRYVMSKKSGYKERSAVTGRYVPKGTEKRQPRTTVREKPKRRDK